MIAVNRAVARRARRRSRWFKAGAALIAVTVVACLEAPYADVEPGPAPDLTTLVAEANDPSAIDPTFTSSGVWHATTISATALTWSQAAVCALSGQCNIYPLATGPSSAQHAAESMTESVAEAAALASAWTDPTPHHETVMGVDMGDVGGASAGLMLTLAFIDAASDGDLTGGRAIAGTGTINSLSEVGPVAGVEHKVRGAVNTGATVFFVPHLREEEAREAARGLALEVVPVAHLEDALRWLCENGGASPVCASPALKGP